jgi:hypothetical protein
MKRFVSQIVLIVMLVGFCHSVVAWEGMATPRLKVDGRYLKDPHGNIINLHGFAQTYSPWFNERGTKWSNYNVAACLAYNKGKIDEILEAGWKMSYIRLHMDPYWSNTPGCTPHAHELPNCFNVTRFTQYLDEVFIPMAEYAISKGLYVVMRPPGVAPEVIGVEDDYNYAQYLMTVWDIVSSHPKINSRDEIMLELANEPINIRLADGSVGANTQPHFDVLKEIFQPIVNKIRENGFHNVLWIPGSGYQAHYKGFAVNPIEGENIGYAVHLYPGWFGSANGYDVFKREWDEQVKPIADIAPILITEMDWAPEKYNSSWGKGITGTAGGEGFGANFKKIMDDTGNAGWLLFTEPHLLAQFTGEPPAPGQPYTFLNDPEACPWPIYHWFLEYAEIYEPRPDFEYRSISDNGSGTFTNPVLTGNFPAPVIVKKNDTYYLVSLNLDFFPEATVLESKDLVNWEFSIAQIDDLPMESVQFVDASDVTAGSFIESSEGEWWAIITYQDGPLGHLPYLLPAVMENGNLVVLESLKNLPQLQKPNVGIVYRPTSLATNDNFRHWTLAPQWGWAGVSDDQKWSLLDRAGFIRLSTANVASSISDAHNVLSQRILAYPKNDGLSYGTIRMEIGEMVEGDVAGLSVFHDVFAFIGVKKIGGENKLVTFINDEMQIDATVIGTEIYLRAVVNNNTGNTSFYYSLDNSTYTSLGVDFVLDDSAFGPYSGYRFGMFNYATIVTGGYVDVDWFSTENQFSEESFYPVDFEGYTEESLTLTDMFIEEGDNIIILTKSSKRLVVKAMFGDGRIEDVGMIADYTNENPDVVTINNGMIRSYKDGESFVTIDYTGPLGQHKQITTNIHSTTFPLTNELFNPNIWENGTFDETTKTLRTGPWGFGGWQYDGVDLSDYKYVVARLGSANTASVDFRLFDQTSYWTSPASYSFGSGNEIVVVLEYAKKGNGEFLNSKNIYIAGFWSNGANPFVIESVFLSNSSEYDPPAILVNGIGGITTFDLSGFKYDENSGPSAYQTFIVSGVLLQNNMVLTAPVGFEISLDPTTGYSTSKSLSHTDGMVDETTIYLRLSSGLSPQPYSGNLVITSTGAYSRTIALSGAVQLPSSIKDPTDPSVTVIKTEYYSLTGHRVVDIGNRTGVFIVREYLSNGTIVTSKIVRFENMKSID